MSREPLTWRPQLLRWQCDDSLSDWIPILNWIIPHSKKGARCCPAGGDHGPVRRLQLRYWADEEGPGRGEGIAEGDVMVTNHPQLAGGSHLPDITVITPVFEAGDIVFYVASRGQRHTTAPLHVPA